MCGHITNLKRALRWLFRDALVTGDASARVYVGPDDVQQVLIAALSRVEPRRQHHRTTATGHVCAIVCESRTLDNLRLSHTSRPSVPCSAQHRDQAASSAALLILQVLDTAQQQEEACRGAGTECGHTAAGFEDGCKVTRQGDRDTACGFDGQYPARASYHAPTRRWYVITDPIQNPIY
jgi:hypothetical protein